jgi:hypothetical protein
MNRSALIFALILAACTGSSETTVKRLNPEIVIAPGLMSFGEVLRLYPVTQTVQILNAGSGALDIVDVQLKVAAAHEGVFELSGVDELERISPGEYAELELTFTPQEYVHYTARLDVESSDEDHRFVEMDIDGTGAKGSTPDIKLSSGSIDFGLVAAGATATQYFTIYNAGDGVLNILDVRLEDGPFSLVTDPAGQAIAAGSEFTVIAEYSPADVDSGHATDLVINSTDPDEPEVTVVFLGGDGGDDYQLPIAKINCDAIAANTPPKTVVMDGRESEDPEDTEDTEPLDYAWTLLDRPELSRTSIRNPTEPAPELFLDVAGVYQIELIVTDFNGIASEPAVCVADIIPNEQLYVALSWDTPNSDLDLHMIPDGESMWGCMDCSFCTPVPGWPAAWGTPVYALDNTSGYGPENINVMNPQAMQYYIRAHYYADHGGGETRATASIYINGELIDTMTASMNSAHRWKIGYVSFDETGEGSFHPDDVVESHPAQSCPDC